MSELTLMDRVIDYLNLIVNVNYRSINELLVGSKVISSAENKELLNYPTSEDAMTNLIYILTKRPEQCLGFVSVLRGSKRRQNHWIAEQIDPNRKYSNANDGLKTKFAKVLGSLFSSSNGTLSSTKEILSVTDFPEESLEARFGSLDSFTSSRNYSNTGDTINNSGDEPPALPPKPKYRKLSNILDGSQTISGFRGSRTHKSLSSSLEPNHLGLQRSSWTQSLLRSRPKSVDSALLGDTNTLQRLDFTTYRDPETEQGKSRVEGPNDIVEFRRPFMGTLSGSLRRSTRFARLSSYLKGSKAGRSSAELEETQESEPQNLHIEMSNGAIKRLHTGNAYPSEFKKSKLDSLTTMLRRVSIRKKKLDRNKILHKVDQQISG